MPSEELIIADTSPLIGLARIGRLGLLRHMAQRVVVPPAVWHEAVHTRPEAPGAAELGGQTWIEVVTPEPALVAPLLSLLGAGEAEALALAQKSPAAVLLLDDLEARRVAERLHLRRMGTVALLARAKAEGFITRLKPELDALVRNGIHLSPTVMEAVLCEVGE